MGARYKLLQPFYCDDAYFEEGAEIDYDGPPNQGMLPLNTEAQERFAEFEASLETPDNLDEIVFREMRDRPRYLRAPRDAATIIRTDEPPPATGLDNSGDIQRMSAPREKSVKDSQRGSSRKSAKIFGGGVVESQA